MKTNTHHATTEDPRPMAGPRCPGFQPDALPSTITKFGVRRLGAIAFSLLAMLTGCVGTGRTTYQPYCPSDYFEPIGDLPGDVIQSNANDISSKGDKVVGGSSADDLNIPNDGDSANYKHADQAFGWTRPCKDRYFTQVERRVPVATGPANAGPATKTIKYGYGGPGLFGFGYPLPAQHLESVAIGISPDGKYVVGFSNEGVSSYHHPVLWHQAASGTMDLLPGDLGGNATDISDSALPALGQNLRVIVGYSHRAGNHPRRAAGARPIYWLLGNPQATELTLPDGLTADSSEANCVSDNGFILAGNMYSPPFDDSGLMVGRGCAWWFNGATSAYQPIKLPSLPSLPDQSDVFGISGNGKIIVGRVMTANDLQPCFWRQHIAVTGAGGGSGLQVSFSGPHLLLLIPGHSWGAAMCANRDGSVIGGESDPEAGNFIGEPVRWVNFGSAERISVILDSLSITKHHGWLLDGVQRMSADGKTLIGSGFHPNPALPAPSDFDIFEGWVAHVP